MLLDIRKTLATDSTYLPIDLTSFPELRKGRCGWRRGRRAGILVRLRRRAHRAPLPSLLLANVQSLENKLCELRARIRFQPDIKNVNAMCLVETWLSSQTPDHAIALPGFSIHRADRDVELSHKEKGGGVCLMINRAWCDEGNITTINKVCSPNLECLILQCRPVWLPREFTSVTLVACYIPPKARKDTALEELHDMVSKQETAHPDTVTIITGDFNHANLRKTLPKLHQHITFKTRGENILDHCYTVFRDGYKALPRPAFGKSDHCSILLVPAYRQRLKTEPPVYKTVQHWTDQSDAILQDCFTQTDWDNFKVDGDLNNYTNNAMRHIRETIEATVPYRQKKILPNQKPWMNSEVHAALQTRSTAYKSGSAEEYKKSRYSLRAAINQAKKEYGQHVESKLITTNPRHLWQGLQSMTDYRGNAHQTPHTTPNFPDEFNTFSARFDPLAKPCPDPIGSSFNSTGEHTFPQAPPLSGSTSPHTSPGASQDPPRDNHLAECLPCLQADQPTEGKWSRWYPRACSEGLCLSISKGIC